MELNLCLGCMEPLPDGADACPHCGYRTDAAVKTPGWGTPIPPGDILHGRYLVGKSLGGAGYYIAYIAYDLECMQKVAIKEFYPIYTIRRYGQQKIQISSAELAGRSAFLKEAQWIAALSDIPGVAPHIREYFTDNNTAYVVMDRLEGCTLSERLREAGRLSFGETMDIMLPVLHTLKAVHTRTWDKKNQSCILHQSVGPYNIFITNDGCIKLFGFDTAKRVSVNRSNSLSVLINSGYAPVELYSSHGGQGPWSDVYSVAATMYKALTGIRPEDAIDRLDKDNLRPPRELGVKMTESQENALMNALAIRMKDRTPTVDQFVQELCSTDPVQRRRVHTKVPLWHRGLSWLSPRHIDDDVTAKEKFPKRSDYIIWK